VELQLLDDFGDIDGGYDPEFFMVFHNHYCRPTVSVGPEVGI
jgi:hypothetical protein